MQIEESVARYMSQLDTADRQTAAGEEPSETVLLTKTRLREKLVKLEEEVKRLAAIEKALLASPDKQISLTDPDCEPRNQSIQSPSPRISNRRCWSAR
jgi:transposase